MGKKLDIGIIFGIRNLPERPKPLNELYEQFISEAVYAEKLGFDHAWNGEHHFSSDQWGPSMFPILAAVASRTERIRIGSAVVCLPMHDPVRIAEDAATVDILSNGRLDLGVGVGSAPLEYEVFGANMKDRMAQMWEGCDVLDKCLSGQPVQHEGHFYRYPEFTMTTRPVQAKIPMWVGTFGPKMIDETARRGYHLGSGVAEPYAGRLAAHGRNPADYYSCDLRWIHVAETREKAWDEAEEGLHHVLRFYREWTGAPGTDANGALPVLPPLGEFRKTPGIGMVLPFLVGTPDDINEHFQSYNHRPITHTALEFNHAGMPTDVVRKSMKLFADEVLPNYR
jgi:alkanesulfonate monooxygenase SsuD/methylene tetrahydromethanopterin reductase-like flavin-dependent oxidoreductase (luciferase family)